jgi:hypothetical protein
MVKLLLIIMLSCFAICLIGELILKLTKSQNKVITRIVNFNTYIMVICIGILLFGYVF